MRLPQNLALSGRNIDRTAELALLLLFSFGHLFVLQPTALPSSPRRIIVHYKGWVLPINNCFRKHRVGRPQDATD